MVPLPASIRPLLQGQKSEVNPNSVWETCSAVCRAGQGRGERKEFRLPRFLPGPYWSWLMGLLGSVGQRNAGVVLVSVTILIYWTNFFSKRELVWVEREAKQTGLG